MRPRAHAPVLVSALIILQKDAVIAAAIGNLRVARLRHSKSAFSVSGSVPGGEGNHSFAVSAWPFEGPFVLLRAVDVIRELVVKIDMIKLRGGLIMLGRPCFTGVPRDRGAAIIAFEQDFSVVRVDPHHMIVAMRCAQLGKCLAAIM